MKLEYDKEEFIVIHDTIEKMWHSTLQLGLKALEQNRILTERRLDLEHAKINLEMKRLNLERKAKNKAEPTPHNTKTYSYSLDNNDAE